MSGLLAAGTIFSANMVLLDSSDFNPPFRYLLGAGCLFFAIVVADSLQRRYRIEKGVISLRVLFIWWRRYLPGDTKVYSDEVGRVLFVSEELGRRVASIPSEYNRKGMLLTEIDRLLRA